MKYTIFAILSATILNAAPQVITAELVRGNAAKPEMIATLAIPDDGNPVVASNVMERVYAQPLDSKPSGGGVITRTELRPYWFGIKLTASSPRDSRLVTLKIERRTLIADIKAPDGRSEAPEFHTEMYDSIIKLDSLKSGEPTEVGTFGDLTLKVRRGPAAGAQLTVP